LTRTSDSTAVIFVIRNDPAGTLAELIVTWWMFLAMA